MTWSPDVQNADAMTDKWVDVVIPAFNEAACIARCVSSILASAAQAGAEARVLVIDNGSTDDTVETARAAGAQVHVRLGINVAGLRGEGARIGSAPVIAFIDADMELSADWMTNALELLADDSVAIAGCSPELPPGAGWVARTWQLLIQARPAQSDRGWLGSSNLLVRRTTYEQIGGFSDNLVTGEDVDFCYRANKHGRVVSDTRLRAFHHGYIASLKELFSKEIWRGKSNYQGVLQHGFRRDELPSLVHPLLSLGGLAFVVAGLIVGQELLVILGVLAIAAFPVAMTLRIVMRTRRWTALPGLLVVWTSYAAARAVAAVIEFKLMLTPDRARQQG